MCSLEMVAVVIRSALAPFDCDYHGGVYSMDAEPSIACNGVGAHGRMTIVGALVLSLYGGGVPMSFAVFLFWNRDRVRADQRLREAGGGESQLTNPNFQLRTRYRKMYEDYKPQFLYWKLVLIVRKLTFACVVVLLSNNVLAQVRSAKRVLVVADALSCLSLSIVAFSRCTSMLLRCF